MGYYNKRDEKGRFIPSSSDKDLKTYRCTCDGTNRCCKNNEKKNKLAKKEEVKDIYFVIGHSDIGNDEDVYFVFKKIDDALDEETPVIKCFIAEQDDGFEEFDEEFSLEDADYDDEDDEDLSELYEYLVFLKLD